MKKLSLTRHFHILTIMLALAGAAMLGACVVEPAISDDVAEQALESTAAPQELGAPDGEYEAESGALEPAAICPRRWTCDSFNFYSSQSICIAHSGCATCYRDYDCNGFCVCP